MEGIGSTKLICTSKKRKLLTFAMHWHQSHVRNKIHCTALKRGPCKTILTASPGAFAPARKCEELTQTQVLQLQLLLSLLLQCGAVGGVGRWCCRRSLCGLELVRCLTDANGQTQEAFPETVGKVHAWISHLRATRPIVVNPEHFQSLTAFSHVRNLEEIVRRANGSLTARMH